VGDIDAFAFSNRTALLISCKSVPGTDAYERGDYVAIRNAGTLVACALDDWDDFLGRLRRNPLGDNCDLRDLDSLLGVVVTSRPLFAPSPLCDRLSAPGLRSYATLYEVLDWLNRAPE
jgi:hypothetical protein